MESESWTQNCPQAIRLLVIWPLQPEINRNRHSNTGAEHSKLTNAHFNIKLKLYDSQRLEECFSLFLLIYWTIVSYFDMIYIRVILFCTIHDSTYTYIFHHFRWLNLRWIPLFCVPKHSITTDGGGKEDANSYESCIHSSWAFTARCTQGATIATSHTEAEVWRIEI